jgi:hypothetical protein
MHGTANGEDILFEMDSLLNTYALPLNKPEHIVSDGAPAVQ